jgi:hypothetical protein
MEIGQKFPRSHLLVPTITGASWTHVKVRTTTNWKVLIGLNNKPLAVDAADVGMELSCSPKAKLAFVIGEPSEIGADGGGWDAEAIRTAKEDATDLMTAIHERAPEPVTPHAPYPVIVIKAGE